MTTTRPSFDTLRRANAVSAVAVAVALRVVGVVVFAITAATTGHGAHARLVRWDANWYAGVAENGYGFTRLLPDGRHLSDEAFFPLYPLLERIVHAALGLSYKDAGLLVSAVSLVPAAWGIFAIGARLSGPTAGVALTAIWAGLPTAIVLSMAYSETLFVALAAWSLHAVMRRRWLLAAMLSVLAGLTRPLGVAVAAAVIVTVIVELVRGRTRNSTASTAASVDDGAVGVPGRAIAAAVLAPLGWVGFVAWVGWRRGDPLGYFTVQDGWGNGFDGGHAFAAWIVDHLVDTAHPAQVAAGVGLLVGVAIVLGGFVLTIRDRQPLPLLVYTGVLLIFALTTSRYFGSKPRYLLPAFPLLLPVAVRLSQLRPRPAVLAPLLAVPVFVAAAIGGAFTLLGSGPP